VVVPAPASFTFEPGFIVAVVGAAVAYAWGARGRAVARWKGAVFGAGLVLVVVPLNSPLETLAEHYLLLAHLLQNAIIADWAPPLLIIGLTAEMRRAVERVGGRVWGALTAPGLALPLWLVGWYGVHLPALFEAALRHPQFLNLEHAFLIMIGLCFWWPVFASPARVGGVLVLYLIAAFVGAAFLGLAFTFIPHPFYSFYVDAPRIWGLSPSEDQNLGGVIMNAEQSIVFLAAIFYVMVVVLDQQEINPSGEV
jgi:cytochrome c oxidase assembly factor CtaG